MRIISMKLLIDMNNYLRISILMELEIWTLKLLPTLFANFNSNSSYLLNRDRLFATLNTMQHERLTVQAHAYASTMNIHSHQSSAAHHSSPDFELYGSIWISLLHQYMTTNDFKVCPWDLFSFESYLSMCQISLVSVNEKWTFLDVKYFLQI